MADNLELAKKYFKRGNAKIPHGGPTKLKVAKLWEKAADLGYIEAQFALGDAYANAKTSQEDRAEHNYWGFWEHWAYNQLTALTDGKNIKYDYLKAEKYLLKAKQQGHGHALSSLAKLYCKGDAGVVDYQKLVPCAHEILEQNSMAILYKVGNKVAQSLLTFFLNAENKESKLKEEAKKLYETYEAILPKIRENKNSSENYQEEAAYFQQQAHEQIQDHNLTTPSLGNSKTLSLEEELAKLDSMIGLDPVKKEILTLIDYMKIAKLRKDKGIDNPPLTLHLVFSGNPGTGKTTVARTIGGIYKAMGLLSSGHVVETLGRDMVGEYLGQTAPKVHTKVNEAIGGILFIDEAYAMKQRHTGSISDYGDEALATLLADMENHRDQLAVIVAGYSDEMDQFVKSNPGLPSRFPLTINFPDYSANEMASIFKKFAEDANYTLAPSLNKNLPNIFENVHNARDRHFGNGRVVRNIFDQARKKQTSRLIRSGQTDKDALVTLTPEDLEI